MKKLGLLLLSLSISVAAFSQDAEKAKSFLEGVSKKMGAYKNMSIHFSQTLSNEDAGINENDELPIKGIIKLEGEKYNLEYQGNTFIYDGKKMYVINKEEKEITVSDEDFDDDDGFIYPSKLLTFYKEGYNFGMGDLKTIKGKKTQFIVLTRIDRASEIVKIELGVDVKTNHIYKLIQLGENGTKTIFTIDIFKNNQILSENVFSFDKDYYLAKNYIID